MNSKTIRIIAVAIAASCVVILLFADFFVAPTNTQPDAGSLMLYGTAQDGFEDSVPQILALGVLMLASLLLLKKYLTRRK